MTCWNCAPELCCARCRRPVRSGEAPEHPGRLCSECYYDPEFPLAGPSTPTINEPGPKETK